MVKFYISLGIIFFSFIGYSFGFEQMDIPPEKLKELMKKWKPLKVSKDAISWDKFAKTSEKEECTVTSEGYDYCIAKPLYTPDIMALDGKSVTIMGYMFPLSSSDEQEKFLIGPYPLSCPFHYHVGANQTIEVIAKDTVTFSYEAVTLKGTFLAQFNEETGVFYYLKDAVSK